jgi:hypothetical protein
VRYFLTGRHPEVSSILLVESGSRGRLERAIPPLRQSWGDQIPIDLVTCYAGLPEGLRPETTRVYDVTVYRGKEARGRLYRELAQQHYSLLGIVCSGEPLLTKWKWALALRLSAKVFIINENGDYFPLDRKHSSNLRRLMLVRADLGGAGAARTLAQILLFPFTLAYLLLYATAVHARRTLRKI